MITDWPPNEVHVHVHGVSTAVHVHYSMYNVVESYVLTSEADKVGAAIDNVGVSTLSHCCLQPST